ncbi:MAG: formamidopyrimidine-DNA glycosylase [Acidimicrobiia bacterium]|nr:formamidopyrimidine-DNA glycosylase [Acidimicrobiia bacterium]NNF70358.1 formamidopyrimidine-DNA glycosylase [Acidimicrobiia bacterium]
MPELPEIVTYLEALEPRIVGQPLERIRLKSFSLLKTFDPPTSAVEGTTVTGLSRIGKRIVWEFDELFLVFHLMIAGRMRWRDSGAALPGRIGLAAFDFPTGTVLLTEAGTKRRASLHVIQGREALADIDPGGIEVIGSTPEQFRDGLLAERHTLKRALSDARFISGIGGAFADEILHRARLSPMQMNTNLDENEIAALHLAAEAVLVEWIERRRADVGDEFPEKVTAFHEAMAVHGKFGEPCPVCETPVQRIVYASRETNYCPTCQTGGKVLSDRSLSRLLKDDWPKTVDDL